LLGRIKPPPLSKQDSLDDSLKFLDIYSNVIFIFILMAFNSYMIPIAQNGRGQTWWSDDFYCYGVSTIFASSPFPTKQAEYLNEKHLAVRLYTVYNLLYNVADTCYSPIIQNVRRVLWRCSITRFNSTKPHPYVPIHAPSLESLVLLSTLISASTSSLERSL
jgi:hypothetical protein